jgi:molybdopterin molybdotransferase
MKFDKIEIKPGKPTTFGMIGKTAVLNLPGNPLAAALNFELFGQNMILALSGVKAKYLSVIETVMTEDFKVKPGRRTLVPGSFDGSGFSACKKFAPGMVSPLAASNAFVMLDASVSQLNAGERVKVIPTRFAFNSGEPVSLITGV